MTYDEIEVKLKTAVKHATPDKLDEILKRCTPPKKLEENKKIAGLSSCPYKKWTKTLAAIAAAFVLVIAGAAGLMNFNNAGAVKAVIGIDVNPSLQIKIDARDKVLEVTAENEDGKEILDGLRLEGTDLDSAVNSVIEKLVENKFITNENNSVLVSVRGDSLEKANGLRQYVAERVENSLRDLGISSALLSSSSRDKNAEAVRTAQDLGISESKACLILSISDKLPEVSGEDLADLTVSELNVLMNVNGISAEGFISCGVPNLGAYINSDQARNNALNYIKIPELGESKITMSCESGELTYKVSFSVGNLECSCGMNAKTGAILGYLAELKEIDGTIGDKSVPVASLSEKNIMDKVLEIVNIPEKNARNFSMEKSDRGCNVTFEADGMDFDCQINDIGDVVRIAAVAVKNVGRILTPSIENNRNPGINGIVDLIGEKVIPGIFRFIGIKQ